MVDKSTSMYTVGIPNSRRHPTFNVTDIKKYVENDGELFPNRQQRKPRIILDKDDPNDEVEKLIGHERRRNGDIRFLCKWDGFSDEDATYRKADEFKTSAAGVKLVKDYFKDFKELPTELKAWKSRTDWIQEAIKEDSSSFEKREGEDVGTSSIMSRGLGPKGHAHQLPACMDYHERANQNHNRKWEPKVLMARRNRQ